MCTIFTIGDTPDGRRFIAMEYVPGQTLRRRLEAGTMTVAEALDVATQIASGMTAAHADLQSRDTGPNWWARPHTNQAL